MTAGPPLTRLRLAAGVVAYNDAERLGAAVASLLDQPLPPNVEWTGLWLVVSPSEDRTVEVARSLAGRFPGVHLVEEAERAGKSSALAQLFAQMEGDYAVLLNGDAEAQAGAVAQLVSALPNLSLPFAIMARPVPGLEGSGAFEGCVRLLWQLHHRLHADLLSSGRGTHVSDEMLLVSLRYRPPFSPGIINDGAFIGGWVVREGGVLAYASAARVRVAAPASVKDLVQQRRRIRHGHSQAYRLTGVAPTTLDRRLVRDPGRAVRVILESARAEPHGTRSLLILAGLELAAAALTFADRIMGRKEPVIWPRVSTAQPRPGTTPLEATHGN